MKYKRPSAKRVLIQVNMNNKVTCFCGKPSGLLCSLRGVGNENSDKTLSKDRGKREVNSSTSGDDLESRKERLILVHCNWLVLRVFDTSYKRTIDGPN